MRTPRQLRTLAIYAISVFLTSPLVVALYFFSRWLRGDYPPDADSIGIPILGYALFYLPFFMILLCAALWKYPGRVPLYAWNRERPVWSVWWTLVFLILAYQAILMVVDAIQGRMLLVAVFFILQLHVLLLLRGSVVSRANISAVTQQQTQPSDPGPE